MANRFRRTIIVAVLAVSVCQTLAKDRTLDEFKAYAGRRIAKVDEAQLTAFAHSVDRDGDGQISDTEFSARIDVYQQVFQRVEPVASRGHELPENWMTDFAKARQKAESEGKPVLAMFSASWCGPCKMMIANVYPTDEAKRALQDFVPVYIDSEKQRDLATKNDIRAFPTFICFDASGEAVEQHVGGGGVEKFLDMLAAFKTSASVASQ